MFDINAIIAGARIFFSFYGVRPKGEGQSGSVGVNGR